MRLRCPKFSRLLSRQFTAARNEDRAVFGGDHGDDRSDRKDGVSFIGQMRRASQGVNSCALDSVDEDEI